MVKPHLRGLPQVVEFLAQTLRQLLVDLVVLNGVVHAMVDRHGDLQLAEVGLHRARHVGILQLTGDRRTVVQEGLMHLTETRGGGSFLAKALETRLPIGPQLTGHAPPDEGPSHGRRIGLQLRQFRRIFRRQGVRNGRQDLGDLHQRPFQPA